MFLCGFHLKQLYMFDVMVSCSEFTDFSSICLHLFLMLHLGSAIATNAKLSHVIVSKLTQSFYFWKGNEFELHNRCRQYYCGYPLALGYPFYFLCPAKYVNKLWIILYFGSQNQGEAGLGKTDGEKHRITLCRCGPLTFVLWYYTPCEKNNLVIVSLLILNLAFDI